MVLKQFLLRQSALNAAWNWSPSLRSENDPVSRSLLKVNEKTCRLGTLLFGNRRAYSRIASKALPLQKPYTKTISAYSTLEYVRGIVADAIHFKISE